MGIIVHTRKRKKYVVNTGTGIHRTNSGWKNFCEFGGIKAAMRYFKANPKRGQIDLRGVKNPCCLYYKEKGKIYKNT